MDTVEIAMHVEEIFAIDLPDRECASVTNVGGLFSLVLDKLHLPRQSTAELEQSIAGRDYSATASLHLSPWNAADVWATLRGIIADQLQVKAKEIRESSTFVRDLGCD